MLNIGPQELLLILVIALVVVGPRRLPELGRTIGRGLREVRKAQDEVRRTIQVSLDEEERPTLPPRRRGRRTGPHAGEEEPTPEAAADAGPTGSVPGTEATTATTAPAAAATDDSGVSEISRTLGQSLRELRRAREEVQRSFRVDVDRPASRPTRATPARSGGPASAPPEDEPHAQHGGAPPAPDHDPASE